MHNRRWPPPGASAGDIAAIGITNQRETTIVWDRETGEPVCNAIVWQDRRTAAMCDKLKAEGLQPLFQGRTGLVLDAYFSGTKLRWILDNVTGARSRAEAGKLCFGTVDSWLIWNLTGGTQHITDATNASRTLLFNVHNTDWDDKLLGLLGVPRSVLPKVVGCSEVCAHTAAALFGAPIPIAGIAGDQQAALFGQRCVTPGMVKNTYGTGCFMLMNTGERPIDSSRGLITTVAWRLHEHKTYALEGSVFIAGAAVQWLRDGLGLIRTSGEVDELAARVPDNGGVYLVPAFAGLGAPHWDPYARGALVGSDPRLNRGTFGPRDAGVDCLSDGRSPRCNAGRFRHCAQRIARGWRGHAQRPADAVSGRYAQCAGGPSQAAGVYSDGGGLFGRSGGRVLARCC